MAKTYRKYLVEEFTKAQERFDNAKEEVAQQIAEMTAHIAVDYGAGYASKVEAITEAAAVIKTLREAIRAYDYFESSKEV